MDQKRKTRKIKDQKQRKQKISPLDSIPIPAHALNSSYLQNSQVGNDFYTWVNKKWLDKTTIPSFESDFGVSEEAERVIFKKSKEILEEIKDTNSKSPDTIFLKTLAESCLHS